MSNLLHYFVYHLSLGSDRGSVAVYDIPKCSIYSCDGGFRNSIFVKLARIIASARIIAPSIQRSTRERRGASDASIRACTNKFGYDSIHVRESEFGSRYRTRPIYHSQMLFPRELLGGPKIVKFYRCSHRSRFYRVAKSQRTQAAGALREIRNWQDLRIPVFSRINIWKSSSVKY